jgi:hypothetical protein
MNLLQSLFSFLKIYLNVSRYLFRLESRPIMRFIVIKTLPAVKNTLTVGNVNP